MTLTGSGTTEQLRQLRWYLHREVIEPSRLALAEAAERRQMKHQEARAAMAEAQAEFNSARADIERKLKTGESQLDDRRTKLHNKLKEAAAKSESLRAQLDSMLARAKRHGEKTGTEVPESNRANLELTESVSQDSSDALLQAVGGHVSNAEFFLDFFMKAHQPRQWWWPDSSGIGCLGLVIAYFLAFAAGSATTSGAFGFFVFLVLFGLFLTLPHVVASSKLQGRCLSFMQAKGEAECWIECYLNRLQQETRQGLKAVDASQQGLKKETQKAIAAAEARYLRPAQEEHRWAMQIAEESYQRQLDECRQTFRPVFDHGHELCEKFVAMTGFTGAGWDQSCWQSWAPAVAPAAAVSMGRLRTDTADLAAVIPDGRHEFSLPALVPFARGSSLLFEVNGEAKHLAIQAFQAMMLRLLATIPPGKLSLTLVDPVGLGQNVAPFMSLADHAKSLITGKAWTEPGHIEQRLADLTEHMETVIQKYLRSAFATIEDYNDKAGEVAEPYRLLVVFDFPVNFNDTAARRLVSIAQNGPRCGVHTIVMRDTAKPLPYGFNIDDLKHVATVIRWDERRFVWDDKDFEGCLLDLDRSLPHSLIESVVALTGERAKEAIKVEVLYEKLLRQAPLSPPWWKGTTLQSIHVPLGPTGARDLQYLTLGEGTAHHAIVIGRTGSGKSNLMHIIITSLALAYPPEEVQLYLVDFKQGVEFKRYAEATLPHARVIAIESEREFGLSVLLELDAEMLRRGEMFRSAGVNNLADYRRKNGVKLPRILLVVDEFQEFFIQDDNISRQAAMIFDHLVRQGRYSGIHVMLGSQTLAGSYTLARSTLDQMGVRIALQCSEADSRHILADDNPAARLLSRPGEAIYNADSGRVDGNCLFQVALFTETDRISYLDRITGLVRESGREIPAPVIFEGNEPARLEQCHPLREVVAGGGSSKKIGTVDAWLGEPVSIRPPTAARFRRQSGNHLLVVVREEADGLGIVFSAVLSLLAQPQSPGPQFLIVDLSTPDTSWADYPEELADLLPQCVRVLGRSDIPRLLKDLVQLVNARLEGHSSDAAPRYLVIQGLHRARSLRLDEDMPSHSANLSDDEGAARSPAELFATLLREGPEVGVHVLAWCDTIANCNRVIDRRTMREFSMRVAGPLSNDDSMHLIDDTAAARLDKPHRAIFYDEETPGYLEKFRPYAIPDKAWLRQTVQRLTGR